MRITEFDINLHGLLIYRSQQYHIRRHCPDFEESLAKLFLVEVEKDIDQKLQSIDISSINDVLSVPHKTWLAAMAMSRRPRGH